MDFYAVLDQVVDLLRSRGRVSYREQSSDNLPWIGVCTPPQPKNPG